MLVVGLVVVVVVYQSIYLSISLSANLKTKLFCETSSNFELDNIRISSAAILRDFPIFELDDVKSEAIL